MFCINLERDVKKYGIMINTPFPHSTFSVNNVPPPEVSHMLHNFICVSVSFFFFPPSSTFIQAKSLSHTSGIALLCGAAAV